MNRLLIVCFTLALFSCTQPEEKKETTKKHQPKKVAVSRPDFNEDSAYHYIQQQVDFGPRVPNTPAHAKAADYLSRKLESFGFQTQVQEATVTAYNGQKLHIKNIIGSHKPELNNRIMLFAHWDSRPYADQDEERSREPIDGANDGASGVGVLLEIARQIGMKNPEIGVDIFLFDAEDYGKPTAEREVSSSLSTWCLGSQYWANNLHKANYTANYGLLLDMVGATEAKFAKEAYSMYYAPQIVEKVWHIASELGHGDHFIFQRTAHVGEDDHVYVNKIANIPSIDIIQYDPATGGFAPHWHTHDDTMEVIDKNTLEAVGETVLATVLYEAKQLQ
jgi:Zn-dependent M28 family amino/carboxypeptidase